MITNVQDRLQLLQFSLFSDFPEIVHGVVGRHGGVSEGRYGKLNLGWSVGDAPEAVAENRRRSYASLGLDPSRPTAGRQVHVRAALTWMGLCWGRCGRPSRGLA